MTELLKIQTDFFKSNLEQTCKDFEYLFLHHQWSYLKIYFSFLFANLSHFYSLNLIWWPCNSWILDTYRHHFQNSLLTLSKTRCTERMKYLAGHWLPSILIKIRKKIAFPKVWFYHWNGQSKLASYISEYRICFTILYFLTIRKLNLKISEVYNEVLIQNFW